MTPRNRDYVNFTVLGFKGIFTVIQGVCPSNIF